MKPATTKKDVKSSRITKQRAEDFYKKLQSVPQFPIPNGDFQIFDKVDITVTAHAGV